MNSAGWNKVREELITVGVSAVIYGLKYFLERRNQGDGTIDVEAQTEPSEPPHDHDHD